MKIDDELRKTADEIRKAATQITMPGDVRWPNRATALGVRVATVAVVLAGGVGALMVTANGNSGELPTPADAVSQVSIERFTVGGMNVEGATESIDGKSSEILLNTETPEPDSSLPAVWILTGDQPAADLSGWEIVGDTAHVLGETVEVRTLNGDPLGITWTGPSGVPVTLIGEGFDNLKAFKNMLTRVKPLSTSEWETLTSGSSSGRGQPREEVVPDTEGGS